MDGDGELREVVVAVTSSEREQHQHTRASRMTHMAPRESPVVERAEGLCLVFGVALVFGAGCDACAMWLRCAMCDARWVVVIC